MTAFVVQTDENEIGILMTEETYVFSFVDGMTSEDFQAGPLTDVIVSVDCDSSRRSLITQDGRKITAYHAKQIEIKGVLTTETATLADGANVNVWRYSNADAYTLQNGIELLRIQNTKSFNDLEEAAQKKVLAFYQNQGLLYEVQTELEKAYASYLQTEDPSQFDSYMICQDISPIASNEKVLYFLTVLSLPIDGRNHYEYRICTAFDRTTGAQIRNCDLFSCPPEEAIQTILDIAEIADPVLRNEMEHAFEPDSIILFPDHLEICFRYGTLPSQEHDYILGLDYNDVLFGILHEWAVPTT